MSQSIKKLAEKEYRRDALSKTWFVCDEWFLWVQQEDSMIEVGRVTAMNSAMKFKNKVKHHEVLKLQYTDDDEDLPSNDGIVLGLAKMVHLHDSMNKLFKSVCALQKSPTKEASKFIFIYMKCIYM